MVTKLAKSFGIFEEPGAMFLTRTESRPLHPRLLKTACIVTDMVNETYLVPVDGAVKVPVGVPIYDDDIGRSMKNLGLSVEAMMHYLSIAPPAGEPARYTYIPSWEERWVQNAGGAGTSGTSDGDDEDEE
ncbi:unnamed protein product [Lactuca virosa]|uniref:Uncharacterized protein n=1 Tax=Lactuca virosa TaxID=75947 RepID=A0AAU9LV36_9ASTR|nr:unnamed protein product [Lactuca virosa]